MSSYIPRSLLDQAKPETSDPSYRMSTLPFATYPNADGSGEHLGFAVPGMIEEPMNALMRLLGTPSNPGTFTQGPGYGSNSEDMRTLLETFLGGQATKGMGAVERGATEAALPSIAKEIPDYAAADLSGPFRAYHGTSANIEGQFIPSESGTFGPAFYAAYDDPSGYGKGANFARNFADAPFGGNYDPAGVNRTPSGSPKIFPLDVNGRIATTKEWNDAVNSAGNLPARERHIAAADSLRAQGFDGASDRGELGLWNRGTVTSPLTGETLFSDNLPSLPGAVVAGAERNTPVRAYHGTAGDLQGGMFNRDRAGNNFPNEVSKFGVSFDTNPDVAAKYAEGAGIMPAYWKHLEETRRAPSLEMIDELGRQSPAAIYPVDIYGKGADLSQGFHDLGATQMAAELQRLKEQGFDYARFPSERGQGHHEINVWNPGTVRSALTGETLFSNGLPSLWGAAVKGQQNQPYPNSLFTY